MSPLEAVFVSAYSVMCIQVDAASLPKTHSIIALLGKKHCLYYSLATYSFHNFVCIL